MSEAEGPAVEARTAPARSPAPAKARRARKPFKASARERKLVETLAGHGVPLEEIRRIAVNPRTGKPHAEKTLLRCFGGEIARGLAKANAEVAESLYRLAVGQPKVVLDGKTLQGCALPLSYGGPHDKRVAGTGRELATGSEAWQPRRGRHCGREGAS